MTGSLESLKILALGLTAGVLSGMFGIGGGLVIVPALVILFGFSRETAAGTSLFALLLPTGLLGMLEYWRNDHVRVGAGLWVALGIFLGAYVGAVFEESVSPALMRRIYALFLIVVAVYFLWVPDQAKKGQAAAAPDAPAAIGDPPRIQTVH